MGEQNKRRARAKRRVRGSAKAKQGPVPLDADRKRKALSVLSVERLARLTGARQLDVRELAAARAHIDALVGAPGIDDGALFHDLKKDELKQMCRALGLATSGTKAVLVGRLLGDAKPHPATGPASIRRSSEPSVLGDRSALIVVPSEAERRRVGRLLVCEAVSRPRRPCVYLVPSRALAWEAFDALQSDLATGGSPARLRIATGDGLDPVEPSKADVFVATYEAFDGLLLEGRLAPAVVVIDEIQGVVDGVGGPVLEMLLTRLRAMTGLQLCGLSAVTDEARSLAGWLGIDLVDGGAPGDERVGDGSPLPGRDLEWMMRLVLREAAGVGEVGRDALRRVLTSTFSYARDGEPADIDRLLDFLCEAGLLVRAAAGFRASASGRAAARAGLGLSCARKAFRRVDEATDEAEPRGVALWTLQDFFAEPEDQTRWRAALERWLDEVPTERIELPAPDREEFESCLAELSRVADLYAEAAGALGKPHLARAASTARGCLRHGVRADALPLAGLNIPELRRARCRYLLQKHAIHTVSDLARATPSDLAEPGFVALETCREWVRRAQAIEDERARIDSVPETERRAEIDALVARLRVEAPSLE